MKALLLLLVVGIALAATDPSSNLQHNNDDKGPYPYPYPYVTSDIEKRASSEHGIQLKSELNGCPDSAACN
uniref:Putative conserved secreted protein fat body overexpressed n=1 Tax=Rhipicephalus microplus TaxID=6941 RepID=A0A034WYU4_RHIMP